MGRSILIFRGLDQRILWAGHILAGRLNTFWSFITIWFVICSYCFLFVSLCIGTYRLVSLLCMFPKHVLAAPTILLWQPLCFGRAGETIWEILDKDKAAASCYLSEQYFAITFDRTTAGSVSFYPIFYFLSAFLKFSKKLDSCEWLQLYIASLKFVVSWRLRLAEWLKYCLSSVVLVLL